MTSETKGSPLLQYIAAVTGTLAIVTDGMIYGWSSPSLPQLKNNASCTVCIDENQGSNLAVMPLVGAVIGSLTAATIVDILGRKRTILATAVPFFLSWIMVAFARSVVVLYIARLIAGIADGVTFTVVPMYIGEIADPQVRGMLGSSCSVTWIAGFLIINVIGSYLSIKTTALISSVVPAILFITFLWMPESPYYLLMRDQPDAARRALERFKKGKDVSGDLHRIRTAIQAEEKSHKGRFVDLFRVKSNRKAVLIIGGLRGFQQLAGTTAIAFYTHEIFQTAGDHISAHYAVMIYYSIQLVLTMFSSSIVDRAGRRPLLLISMAGSALALFVEGTYFYILNETSIDTSSFSIVAVVGLLAFVILFSLGMQSIPICMLGELFPTNVKAFALCLADVYFSVMATVASKYLQITKVEYGLHVSFYGFGVCSLLGLVFIYFFVPETKGKTLEDIQKKLRGEVDDYDEKTTEEEKVSLKA
ncbi:facilitated trehalose transporter Tret1-like [Tribolium madens]|uniref:facilitated trehalose transporter Tret1-like n=1 Tax=Tribolium madens TaxID=41895 RepID=UPI001CF74C57|nr:facilitated trehalose transporter Tret1-like [Tribolium madens]XP_044270097.1 facilitated trehalose transporter Tret1-like [Tribolium madens]